MTTEGARNLFAYGTLQFAAIAAAVTGRALDGEPAVLAGYARYRVRGQPFPGLVPRAGARVEGVLYRDLDVAAWRRIDAFEGALYRREPVEVRRLGDGARIPAEAYVVRPRWRKALTAAAWDPEAFARRWHDHYVDAAAAERRAGELD